MAVEQEQAAFVLHSRPYRDHQVILELLTEHSGKVSVMAYLSKSAKSNNKALFQSFLPLTVTLKGNGALKKLSRVESSTKSYALQGNYLYSAFYLNELLVRLLGDDIDCAPLFLLYQQSLVALQQQQSIELVLRKFEQQLLAELGLCLDFSPVYENDHPYYYYLDEHGFVPAVKPYSQVCYSQQHLVAIDEQLLDCAQVLKSYKLLMRQVLGQLLGSKPLHSRAFFSRSALTPAQ